MTDTPLFDAATVDNLRQQSAAQARADALAEAAAVVRWALDASALGVIRDPTRLLELLELIAADKHREWQHEQTAPRPCVPEPEAPWVIAARKNPPPGVGTPNIDPHAPFNLPPSPEQ